MSTAPWRPPNWGVTSPNTMMTVQSPGAFQPSDINQAPTGPSGLLGTVPTGDTSSSDASPTVSPTNYFFDAVMRAEHRQEARPTQHPVQDGPAICDHTYLLPSSVVLEIGMSDVMDSFDSGQYSGGPSKSVNAFQQFLLIQSWCQPITLTTKLKTYENMVISDVRALDDVNTAFALKAWITFQQIIPAKASTTTSNPVGQDNSTPTSSDPDTTNSTPLGTKTPDTSQISNLTQYQTPSPQASSAGSGLGPGGAIKAPTPGANVPGAGTWSSNPLPISDPTASAS